jgi:hypothetical protein
VEPGLIRVCDAYYQTLFLLGVDRAASLAQVSQPAFASRRHVDRAAGMGGRARARLGTGRELPLWDGTGIKPSYVG